MSKLRTQKYLLEDVPNFEKLKRKKKKKREPKRDHRPGRDTFEKRIKH